MALHDYRCPDCGYACLDHYVPITKRASEEMLICADCARHRHTGVRLEWVPQVGRIDASSGPSFKSFTMQERQRDGSHREVTISSVSDIRRIERESAVRAQNGEGEAVRFRAWSQDRGNDTNSFGKDPGTVIREDLARDQAALLDRGRRLGRLKKDVGAHVAKRRLGPGVTDATVSPIVVS